MQKSKLTSQNSGHHQHGNTSNSNAHLGSKRTVNQGSCSRGRGSIDRSRGDSASEVADTNYNRSSMRKAGSSKDREDPRRQIDSYTHHQVGRRGGAGPSNGSISRKEERNRSGNHHHYGGPG